MAPLLGCGLVVAVAGAVLTGGLLALIAAVPAAGLAGMGWHRTSGRRPFTGAVAAEGLAALALVAVAGPLWAAAALFAVVLGRALMEPARGTAVGVVVMGAALAGGMAITGSVDAAVLATALLGFALCSVGAGLLVTYVSHYEHGPGARSEALIATSANLVAVVTSASEVVFASPSTTDVLGVEPAALVGTHLLDWVDEADRQQVADALSGLHTAAVVVECRLHRADGTSIRTEMAARNLSSHPAVGGYALSIRNVTERATVADELRHQAYHDPLTKLANRALFVDRLHAALETDRPRAAILLLDLDGFKGINDSLGHEAGDALLAGVAERMRRSVGPGDTVARLGGDEFAILLVDDRASEGTALDVAVRIGTAFGEPVELGEQRAFAQASIGIAVAAPGVTPSALLRNADVAMYQAKAAGKNRVEIFHVEMDREAGRKRHAERQLRHAASAGQWVAHYQPIVDLASGRIQSVEALARWNHPERGMLAPEAFLPLAEETGVVLELGRWMLWEACHRVAGWQQRSIGGANLGLTVNVSVRELRDRGFVPYVRDTLEASGLQPGTLTLDIGEEALNESEEIVRAQLQELRRLGVRVAIDDFGTGSSSLSSLPRFPIDALKIDRSFVSRLTWPDPEAPALTRTIIAMGQALGMTVVAEGVETSEQHAELVGLGCAAGQGFVLARPMSPPALEQLLSQPVLAS